MTSFTELPAFLGCYNLRFGGADRSSEAVLFLHGFPAEQGNKNIDLAQKLYEEFSIDTYIIHYNGLGKSSGIFTFTGSIETSYSYAKNLLDSHGYTRLHIVGHSWGGYVATDVFEKLDVHRGSLTLLAPFTRIDGGEGPLQLALYFLRLHPHIFPSDSLETVRQDLEHVRKKYDANTTVTKFGDDADRVLVIRALKDDVIPPEMHETLIKNFPKPPLYRELESDHRFFRRRDLLQAELREFFARQLSKAE